MSIPENTVTSVPTVTELLAHLQDTWPTLTTAQIYERIDLERQGLARVQETGVAPVTVDLPDLPDLLHGIGASDPVGDSEKDGDFSVNSMDLFGGATSHGSLGEETEEDTKIEKWLSPKLKRLFNYKAEKFDGNSFLTWKKCILRMLEMVKLSDLVLKAAPYTETASFEYKRWLEADRLVINFLNLQLSVKFTTYLNSCTSARGMWTMLLDRFENAALENWSEIFEKWNSHRQGDSQPIDEFVTQQCDFYEQLLALGHNFGDAHRRARLLMGLNAHFQPEARVYRRDSTMSFYQICNDLRIVEISYVRTRSVPPRNNFVGGKSSFPERPPMEYSGRRESSHCSTCGQKGHHWKACPRAVKGADGRYLRICHLCYEPGHFKHQCPKSQRGSLPERKLSSAVEEPSA